MVLSCGQLFGQVSQGDLYRLRLAAPSQIVPGEPFEVEVLVDNSEYPASDSTTSAYAVSLVGFTLELPDSISLVSHVAGAAAQNPAQLAVTEFSGAIAVTLQPESTISTGVGNSILKLTLVSGADFSGELQLGFSSSITPAMFLSSGHGLLVPHFRVLILSTASFLATEVSPFPEPTATELVVQSTLSLTEPVIQSSTPLTLEPLGFEPLAFGGEGAEASVDVPDTLYCNIEVRGYQDEIPPFISNQNIYEVHPGSGTGSTADIATAFNAAKLTGQDSMIRVFPGTYDGSLVLNLNGMTATIIIASTGGPVDKPNWAFSTPNGVTIDGLGAARTVSITGVASRPLYFGWTKSINTEETPPAYDVPSGAYDRGWRGFEITGGDAQVKIDSTGGSEIRFAGNYVHGDLAGGLPATWPLRGGGLCIDDCLNVQVYYNEFEHNFATQQGGGISINRSGESSMVGLVKVVRNWIHDNQTLADTSVERVGGGLSAAGVSLELCTNWIYGNESHNGCGAYYTYDNRKHDDVSFFAFANKIYQNIPNDFNSAFFGGGLAVVDKLNSSGKANPPFLGNWSLGIIRNWIYKNGENLELPTVGKSIGFGGGLSVFWDAPPSSDGPFADFGNPAQVISGNTIYENRSEFFGAGMAHTIESAVVSGTQFHNNTIRLNIVRDDRVQAASFLNLVGGTGYYSAIASASQLAATNCLIQENDYLDAQATGILLTSDWYCWAADTDFTYSRVSDCAAYSPEDIARVGSIYNVGTHNVAAQIADTEGHQDSTSNSRNLGNNVQSFVDAVLANAYLDLDMDREDRIQETRIDIGADELPLPPHFRRGDCNNSTAVDIADVVFLLNSLFVPGASTMTCEYSCDGNDDGQVNIADSIMILNWLFVPGTPPLAAPGVTTCGPDPTTSAALSCLDTSACP